MSLSDSSRERHERDNARRYKERRAHAVSDAGGVTPCTDGTSRRSWQPPSSSGPQPNNSSAEWPPSGGSGLAGNAAFFGYAGSAKGTPEDAGIRRLGGGARTPPPPHLRMEAGQESSPRLGANVSPGSGVVPGGAAREAALQGMRLAMLQETIIAERKGPDDRLNIEFVTVDELVVQEVRAGAAERAGAARFVGHRLAEVNGHSVRTVDDVRAVLSLPGGLNTSLTFVPPKDVKKTRSRRPGPMQQMRADGAPLGSPRGRRTPPPAGGSAPGATPPDAPLGSGPARESSDAQRELRAAVVGHSERDGHTVYRCECCFAGRVFWVCERRLSALKALHDGVKELLGKATYRGLLGESHFPPKGGMPGTTRRLDAWLRALCGALCRPLADGEALRRLVINAVTEEIDRERILPIVLEAYDIT